MTVHLQKRLEIELDSAADRICSVRLYLQAQLIAQPEVPKEGAAKAFFKNR